MPRSHSCIHTHAIINEVKKRPGIFTKADPERYRPNYRDELWTEVASSLYPNWDQLNDYDKKDKVVELKKKWRNLKDSFLKELHYRARLKAGLERRSKRKYLYFDELKFLQPTLEMNVRSSEKPQLPNTNKIEQMDLVEQLPEQRKSNKLPKKCKEINNEQEYEPRKKVRKRLNKVKGGIDEDKTFLLSLVPSFRTMQEEQKLIAKIEILNIIRQIKTSTSDTPDSQSTSGYIFASSNPGDPIKLESYGEAEANIGIHSEDVEEENSSTDSSVSSSSSSD
ncbi:hypothetical protein EVAR_3955_1 [Eumeta japonica]|uniref:MADF domain-containing protein n=1 Tax=Eumeta variegata TaxID=151549 RepID=A0A4C1SRK0_EUMVA|nr:hypothetical protein EVAR_3955_1 [Eumeta japonica]